MSRIIQDKPCSKCNGTDKKDSCPECLGTGKRLSKKDKFYLKRILGER